VSLTISEDEIKLLSVGIDVGSSTSHLVFSKITLTRNEKSYSRRFEVTDREVIYKSAIIDTPLIDPETINVDQVVSFFRSEYEKAGIDHKDVQSGVVIVTGETAKKKNASEIVSLLAEDAGKFVAATAGPNFESMIAAFGSGATTRSYGTDAHVISCDIGGGTSNIAVSYKGEVLSTSCISVGGRLIGFNRDRKVNRIDQPAREVMDSLGLHYKLGEMISESDVKKICDTFANSLVDALTLSSYSPVTQKLLMTNNISVPNGNVEFIFSGGVSEMIYSDEKVDFNDIGYYLGQAIKSKFSILPGPVLEPENKIRATVIGAGCYTLQVSGSTCFLDDDSLDFPLRNVPVISVNIDRDKLEESYIVKQVATALQKFDVVEGEEAIALSFDDPVRASYQKLKIFATGLEKALPNSVKKNLPIILIFKRDIGNSVGNVIRRETNIKDNLASIDEIEVSEGDWIDIGAPLINGQVIPVTVKSLVFSREK